MVGVGVSFPESVLAEIDALIEANKPAFRDRSEFIRDAVLAAISRDRKTIISEKVQNTNAHYSLVRERAQEKIVVLREGVVPVENPAAPAASDDPFSVHWVETPESDAALAAVHERIAEVWCENRVEANRFLAEFSEIFRGMPKGCDSCTAAELKDLFEKFPAMPFTVVNAWYDSWNDKLRPLAQELMNQYDRAMNLQRPEVLYLGRPAPLDKIPSLMAAWKRVAQRK